MGSHVEYESRRFYGAFGLSFSLASVTDALVDRALRKAPPTAATAASFQNPAVKPSSGGNGNGIGKPSGDGSGSCNREDGAGGAATGSATATPGFPGGKGARMTGIRVGGEWAEESRRIEAGEVLSRRVIGALKVCFDRREGNRKMNARVHRPVCSMMMYGVKCQRSVIFFGSIICMYVRCVCVCEDVPFRGEMRRR